MGLGLEVLSVCNEISIRWKHDQSLKGGEGRRRGWGEGGTLEGTSC